jgi:hypothetical protein
MGEFRTLFSIFYLGNTAYIVIFVNSYMQFADRVHKGDRISAGLFTEMKASTLRRRLGDSVVWLKTRRL